MGNTQSNKTIPPISHIINPGHLDVGDHVYRRLNGIKAVVGYHHAIVISTTKSIKIIEMTREHGIRISTLTKFLNGYDCRLVYYNTNKFHQSFHASGSCHVEESSSIEEIRERIKLAKQIMNDHRSGIHPNKHKEEMNPHIYHLLGANCEEFAIWIKTGLYKGMQMTQLKGYENLGSNTLQSGQQTSQSIVSRVAYTALDMVDNVATSASKSSTGSLGSTAGRTAAMEVAENTIKYSAKGIGFGIGISFAIETVCSAYKVYKYKTDYKYTKCDLWRDLGRGWIVSGLCTAVGVALIPIGWWAILPCAALGFVMQWLFKHFRVFDRKSHKEKVYKDYKLDANSSIKELKAVRRKIRRQIREEKLHPDNWPSNLKDKAKPKRLEKYLWLISIRDLLDVDIQRGYVVFDKDKQSEGKPEMMKQIEMRNR